MKLLSLSAEHLTLDFPYDRQQVELIKEIPGARFDRKTRLWYVPLSEYEAVKQFALRFDFMVDRSVVALGKVKSGTLREVTLSDNGKYLELRFPYDEVANTELQTIPTATWKDGYWRVNIRELDRISRFARDFGLALAPEVQEMVAAVEGEMEERIALSRDVADDFEVDGLAGELHPHQRAGVRYMVEARRTFNGDEVGAGKTIQSLATIEHLRAYPCVIVCPSSLTLNWRKEIERWLPQRSVAVLAGNLRKDLSNELVRSRLLASQGFADLSVGSPFVVKLHGKTFDLGSDLEWFAHADFLILGYPVMETWGPKLQLLKPGSMILDELHMCRNYDAKRTRATLDVAEVVKETHGENAVLLGLTGTVIESRPAELVPQLEILGRLKDFGGKWNFYKRYCTAKRGRFGWEYSGAANLEELHEKLRATCYVRRKTSDVADLVEAVYVPLWIEGDPSVMVEYRNAENDIITYVMERAKQIALAMGLDPWHEAVRARLRAEAAEHLVRISVLREIAARAKDKAVREFIEARTAEGNKVIVAAHHRSITLALAERYGGRAIVGGLSVEKVEKAKHEFQTLPAAEAPVLVLADEAGKTGHTLTAAHHVLFVELPWTPATFDQVVGRARRIGQTQQVYVTTLLIENTLDVWLYDIIERKRAVTSMVIDGEQHEAQTVSVAQEVMMRLFDLGRERGA